MIIQGISTNLRSIDKTLCPFGPSVPDKECLVPSGTDDCVDVCEFHSVDPVGVHGGGVRFEQDCGRLGSVFVVDF